MAKRGRRPAPKPGPDGYSKDLYDDFLNRLAKNSSSLNTSQADRRQLLQAETGRGLNRKAHQFVYGLLAEFRNSKLSMQDVQATLMCVPVYAEWANLTDQGDMLEQETEAEIRKAGNGTKRGRKLKNGADKAERHEPRDGDFGPAFLRETPEADAGDPAEDDSAAADDNDPDSATV